MAKRISRQEFNQLMAEARTAYSRDIEAAGGDGGKVALAEKKLAWAEEAAKEGFNSISGFYRFFDSIPIVGKPVATLLDNVQHGIAEHGVFLGLARGLFIGLILAVSLVVATEAVIFVFDIGRTWVELHIGAPIKSRQRAAAIKAEDEREHKAYYADHPNEAPPPKPPEPTVNLSDPVTQSEVHFVEISPRQYQESERAVAGSDEELKSRLRGLTGQLASTANVLPKGTHYTPRKQNPSDPDSIVAIIGDDGNFGLPVKLRDGRYVIIPATEYKPYLKREPRPDE